MKRLFTILTALSLTVSLSSFANDVKVTPQVAASFESSFKEAKEVNWTVSENNLYKANFTMNGQYVTAFYNA